MVRPLNPSGVLDPAGAAAARARAAAGLAPDEPVADVRPVLHRLGVLVAERDLGEAGPDGMYVTDERGGVLVLNTAKPPCRVRRTAAHLLAHHLLGDEPHLDRDIDAPAGDPIQARANAFAARFLAGSRVDSPPEASQNGPTMGQISVR